MSSPMIFFSLSPFRHIAAHDALGQALDDGGLAHAGLADEHGVVLGTAGQDLDHPADLLVATDDRIELAFLGQCRQVAAVTFERLVLVLGILIRHALAAPHLGERRQDAVGRQPVRLQQPGGRGAPSLAGDGEKQMLGADVLVFQAAGLGLRQVGDQLETRRDGGLRSAMDLRLLADGRTRLARDGRRVELQLPQQRRHHAVVLLGQRHQQVFGLDLRMIERLGQLLRADDRPPGPFQ
jgi:hypothetical protein